MFVASVSTQLLLQIMASLQLIVSPSSSSPERMRQCLRYQMRLHGAAQAVAAVWASQPAQAKSTDFCSKRKDNAATSRCSCSQDSCRCRWDSTLSSASSSCLKPRHVHSPPLHIEVPAGYTRFHQHFGSLPPNRATESGDAKWIKHET